MQSIRRIKKGSSAISQNNQKGEKFNQSEEFKGGKLQSITRIKKKNRHNETKEEAKPTKRTNITSLRPKIQTHQNP